MVASMMSLYMDYFIILPSNQKTINVTIIIPLEDTIIT